MYVTLNENETPVMDGETGVHGSLDRGRYEVERVESPFGIKNSPWLVIVGTLIGAAEVQWRKRGLLIEE